MPYPGQLHHVEIYVADLERSTRFWGWLLEYFGYRKHQQWEGGVSWKLGETYLVFVQTGERYLDHAYHRCGTGLNHLAFHAASRDQVDELTRLLRERGVAILYEDRHPHADGSDHYALFCEDPDRIKVEIVALSEA
jgi:catechol 2,3-dioxygenase-like lactoylglutathione lyase family enzyme